MKKKVLTPEKELWIWQKWDEGYRQTDIAEALGISTDTVYRCLRNWQDQGKQKTARGRIADKLEKLSCES